MCPWPYICMVHCTHNSKSHKTARFRGICCYFCNTEIRRQIKHSDLQFTKPWPRHRHRDRSHPGEPRSQPCKQTGSQPDIGKESANTEAERHTDTTMEALLAPVPGGNQWRPERNSAEKSSAVARQHMLGRSQGLLETMDFRPRIQWKLVFF